MHDLFKFLYHRHLDGGRWYPFLGVYYLTYRCDFHCPYCANGANQPYHQMEERAVAGARALRILARLRRHCAHLVITGGEPLMHPDAGQVLTGLGALGYKSVTLNTNGERVAEHLPVIARHVDKLVFSLDTLDANKADAWFGKGPGMLDSLLAAIETAANYPQRRYEILISSVATPNNIADLDKVFDFAQGYGFTFAVCPELQGVRPPEKLRHHEAYRRFFDRLIGEKKRGARIFGSRLYLEHLRDFRDLRCHPMTLLSVTPDGTVNYPCLEIGHPAGNILDVANKDLHRLRARATRQYGPPPACRDQCHSACALGFSLLIEHPLSWAGQQP